jgi:hypothetical protein
MRGLYRLELDVLEHYLRTPSWTRILYLENTLSGMVFLNLEASFPLEGEHYGSPLRGTWFGLRAENVCKKPVSSTTYVFGWNASPVSSTRILPGFNNPSGLKRLTPSSTVSPAHLESESK